MSEAVAVYTGFDSAWTRGRRGAIASLSIAAGEQRFIPPVAVTFDEARAVIDAHGAGADRHLIAIDQPLIVPNVAGSRPCEAVVRPAISRLRGGVQPASRGRVAMFGEDAPIWPFLAWLDASLDPLSAARGAAGRHAFEVFPALASAGLFPAVWERRRLYKYNPERRRLFSLADWSELSCALGDQFDAFGTAEPADWCRGQAALRSPRKGDQDALDAVFCILIACWVDRFPGRCLVAGDLESGYIVTPAGTELRETLTSSASALHPAQATQLGVVTTTLPVAMVKGVGQRACTILETRH